MKEQDKFNVQNLSYGEVKELIGLLNGWSAQKVKIFFGIIEAPYQEVNKKLQINENICKFMTDFFAKGESTIETFVLYQRYCRWCYERGLIAKKRNGFGRYITEHYEVEVKQRRQDCTRVRYYTFKEGNNDVHEDDDTE